LAEGFEEETLGTRKGIEEKQKEKRKKKIEKRNQKYPQNIAE